MFNRKGTHSEQFKVSLVTSGNRKGRAGGIGM